MSNDCTYVNNLTKNKNFDNIVEGSSENIYNKITDYQLKIKVEGIIRIITLSFILNIKLTFYK